MKKRLGGIPKGLEWLSEGQQVIDSLVQPQAKQKQKKDEEKEVIVPAAKRGLQEELIRATFILKQAYLEKIKAYAYWERMQIKDVLEEMCEQYFKEKKIRSVPSKKK